MKNFKKIMALIIACVMTIGMMSTMAFAAELTPQYIKLATSDTHTYKVYQVLTGTLANQGDTNLGDPAWGADAKDTTADVDAFIASLQGKSETEVAALVAAQVGTSATGRGTVDKDHPIEGLAKGYYVLVDTTDLTADGFKNDTKALNVVQVVNNIDGLEIKHDTTEDEKKITTDTLGNTTNPINGAVDNVSVGDTVNYQIKASIPVMATDYNYFYFIITDKLDEGLTFTNGSINVYKESVDEANKLAATTDYILKTGTAAAPDTFQIGMVDAKSLAGKDIYVTYSAVLKKKKKIGEVSNNNTEKVKFSNNPNHTYDGERNPGFPKQEDLTALGETPEKVTKTYTTGIEITKVDQDGKILTGAEFKITGDSAEIVLVSEETFAEKADGEYYGLNNGTYTKEAPVTADYMKEAGAGATEGYVEDSAATGDGVVTVGGKTYRPYRSGDTGTVYILVKANADQYDGKRYEKTVTYTTKNTKATPAVEAKAEVGADGVVRFVGLGEGTYTISETKTPAGFNTLPDFTVDIEFVANPDGSNPHWKKKTTSGDYSYNAETGVFETTVVNRKGATLPSTGGIGTTIFYIIGGILILGAAITLIGKKRFAR